jgi:toxin ParE1/3/4
MRLRYTQPASSISKPFFDYIARHAPQSATRVHARIDTVINLLLSHPRIGTWTGDAAIRRINASPYPYLVFYEIEDDGIVIHAVRHAARDPAAMPGTNS